MSGRRSISTTISSGSSTSRIARRRSRPRRRKNQRKLDVTPFTQQVKNKTTFLFPVTTNAADITALMAPRLDAVYIGSSPVTSLTRLNTQLNDLFKVAQ